MAKKKSTAIPSTPFQDVQILWECEFPQKPEILEELVRERIRLKHDKDHAETRISEINNSLVEFFKRNRISKTEYDGYTFRHSTGNKVTITAKALIEAGVPIATIKSCSTSTPWETIEVRTGKDSEEDI